MTPTTHDMPAIPDQFKRTEAAKPAQTATDKSVARAAKKTAKAAKKAAVKAEKAATPARQKSQIVSTEANPAKSIVPVRFKQRYAAHGNTNGDEVAYAVTEFITVTNADGRPALSLDKIKELAKTNNIDTSRYEGLNMGQWSMNVRNRLRGLLKAGTTIVVGKRKFADKAKALTVRPVEEKTANAA